MTETQGGQPRFEIDAAVVYQLGEDLISDQVQALLELIKNSYDADADYASVTVQTRERAGDASRHFSESDGYIVVEDDGVGMDWEEILRGWLTISASPKRQMKAEGKTTAKGRTPVGDKGLGRLGSQRLGAKIEIWTTKKGSGKEWYVGVNWEDFSGRVLSAVPVRPNSRRVSRDRTGTRIVISDLRSPEEWEGKAQDTLVRKLSELIFPFGDVRLFDAYVSINGRRIDLDQVSESILDVANMQFQLAFDGETLTIEGRYRLTALLAPGARAQKRFERVVQMDQGADFFAYLSDGGNRWRIQGLGSEDRPGWFASFRQQYLLEDLGDVELVGKGRLGGEGRTAGAEGQIASPGPFDGRIHAFSLKGADLDGVSGIFGAQKEFNLFLTRIAGIRVFRDGFGVRPFGIGGNDWLGLGRGWTIARSYYVLRPRNVVGYVRLSARDNRNLHEATDREGFVENPYYRNFLVLMGTVVNAANDVNTKLRRSYNDYAKMRLEHEAGIVGEGAEAALARVRGSSAAVTKMETRVSEARKKLEAVSAEVTALEDSVRVGGEGAKEQRGQVTRALATVETAVAQATSLLQEIEPMLEQAKRSGEMADIVQADLKHLRDELAQFSELAGLGLTAEALSHELNVIADRLAARTSGVLRKLQRPIDPSVVAYTEHVHAAVARMRKQLSHLDPSMRYARERRDSVQMRAFFDDIRDFYSDRFARKHIEMKLEDPFDDFAIQMNRGKLTQIVDNLVLNSEYWLSEDLRKGNISEALVCVRAKAPMIEIYDTGRGVAPPVEHHLFEPFVTTKPEGRGLGLFIARQLLDSSGCLISLLPDRNQFDRRYVFRIDFTGALHA